MSRHCRWTEAALILPVLALLGGCGGERHPKGPPEVHLESRVLSGGTDPNLVAALRDPTRPTVHGVLRFRGPLSPEEHRKLRAANVLLLGYLGNDSYFASIPSGTALDAGPLEPLA